MNKEKQAKYQRAWRAQHPDYQRQWRAQHPDYQRQWRAQNAQGEAEARRTRSATEYLEARGYIVFKPETGESGYSGAQAALTDVIERIGAQEKEQAMAFCRAIEQAMAELQAAYCDGQHI